MKRTLDSATTEQNAKAAKKQDVLDFRSDTVTHPTQAMRDAMRDAEVGDDVWGDDYTVQALEAKIAGILKKEAALFVPSGTMANLIAIMVHCNTRGNEMIVGDQSHIYFYEQGGSATIGGVHPRVVPNMPDGTLDLTTVENAIRGDDVHYPVTRLICLENTHNRCGGRVVKPEYMAKVGQLARKHGLKVHVDGARLFNAVTALGIDASELVADADSVSVCFSKGLAAPVGSCLVGTAAFIKEARRARKALGGGMRQVGILAAAAMISLDSMVSRLPEDHTAAQTIAKDLCALGPFEVDLSTVDTNLVFLTVHQEKLPAHIGTIGKLIEELAAKGVLICPWGTNKVRVVTHYQVSSPENIKRAVQVFKDVLHINH